MPVVPRELLVMPRVPAMSRATRTGQGHARAAPGGNGIALLKYAGFRNCLFCNDQVADPLLMV